MSTYTVTVDVHDFEPSGPVPANAELRIWRVQPDVVDGAVVSNRQHALPVGAGPTSFTVTGGVAYYALFTGVTGWATPFAFIATGDDTLADLYEHHQVDPASLAPTAAPPAAWEIQLAALQAQINGISGTGTTYTQASPAGTWTISHNLGRRPTVAIYLPSGEQVIADVTADQTSVTVTFAAPTAGTAVLT